MVSIVIPVLNEASILEQSLASLLSQAEGHEIVIVDGGSEDQTREIAWKYGRVVSSDRGRGTQMNAGARATSGEILLFLHADCRLEQGALEAIESALEAPQIVGGCLKQRIEGEAWGYRVIERMVRSPLMRRNIYGDQGLFVRREIFLELGGFPEIPLMEDVAFSKILRRRGTIARLGKTIYTSPRRWEQLGKTRTTLTNWGLRVLYECGVSPHRLARFYYGNGKAK